MHNKNLYLRQNVQAEPLLNQWYAVSLMIPPATWAMYIANLHLKIMKSYTLSPEMHAAASQDPAMIGGPFINFRENRVPEIKALLDKTIRENSHRIEFDRAIKSLDQMLREEAVGYSLEPLYHKVPEALKGFVELTYDINNNPSIRLIEKLLYMSPLHSVSSQSIGLSLVSQDIRPFVLSTPRLDDQNYMRLEIPFCHEQVDELFKLRSVPRPLGEVEEALKIAPEQGNLFRSFFTEEPPVKPSENKYRGDDVRIRYFGHACLLIETQNISILTDPLISYGYGAGVPRYTFSDLPDFIDYILITHAHLDHLVVESLLQLRHKVGRVIVPCNGGGITDPSIKLALNNIGFKDVISVDELEAIGIEGGAIVGLPFLGEHHDLNIKGKTTYLIRLNGKSILVAADYCNLETRLCERLNDIYGNVDMLFLGMECDGAPLSWFYGPLLMKKIEREKDYSRRGSSSNHERAIDMVIKYNCKQVYVYAMGLEPWLSYILSIAYDEGSIRMVESSNFIADCKGRGIMAERLFGQKEIFL